MQEVLCKIIASLNSSVIKERLALLGYTYDIAPLNHYNEILRHKYTLDYNIKIFNADASQVDALALYVIKNVFNDSYTRSLIVNNICMLSYSYNKKTTNTAICSIKDVLSRYLGRAVYSYILENDCIKIIIDVPKQRDVSTWKSVIKNKEASIVFDLAAIDVNIKSVMPLFSIDGEEVTENIDTLLSIGFTLA